MTADDSRRQVIRLSMFMAPASVIGMILAIPVGIYTSAVLGPALSGVMRIVDIIQKYFGYNHMGLLQGMGREVPIELSQGDEAEARSIVHETFSGNAITTLLSLALLWGLYLAGVDFNGVLELWLLVAASLLVAIDRLNSLLHVYAKSYGYFDLIARRELFLRLFTPAVTVVSVALLRLQGAVLALLLSSLAGTLFYLLGIRGLAWRFQVSARRIIRVASIGFLVFANNYASSLMETVGLLILAQKMTVTEVGLVGFAFRPLTIAASLVASFNIYFSRHMLMNRGMVEEGEDSLYARFRKYMRGALTSYLWVVALLQGCAYLGFATLTRLFLPEFLEALPVLDILLPMGMMYGVFTYLQFYMNATDQLGRRLLWIVPVLVLNVGLVYVLLDQGVGMAATAWAATISYGIFSSVVLWLAIYQTSGRAGTAASFLIRTLAAMGAVTALALALDAWVLAPYLQYDQTAQRIGFATLDLAPKLIGYLVAATGIFLVSFRGFGLCPEIRKVSRLTLDMARERLARFQV